MVWPSLSAGSMLAAEAGKYCLSGQNENEEGPLSCYYRNICINIIQGVYSSVDVNLMVELKKTQATFKNWILLFCFVSNANGFIQFLYIIFWHLSPMFCWLETPTTHPIHWLDLGCRAETTNLWRCGHSNLWFLVAEQASVLFHPFYFTVSSH